MEITLTPEMQRFVDENVPNGRFASPQEAVLTAVAAFMSADRMSDLSSEEFQALYPGLREKVAEGLADLEAGRSVDGEAFFEELEREEAVRAADGIFNKS